MEKKQTEPKGVEMILFRNSRQIFAAKNRLAPFVVLVVVILIASKQAHTQDTATAKSTEAGTVETENPSPADTGAPTIDPREFESMKRRLAELEAAQAEEESANGSNADQEIEALNGKLASQAEAIEALEDSEFRRVQDEEKKLKIYGFMDVRWYQFIFYQEDNVLEGYLNDHSTFLMAHWNMFLDRQLTDSFRVLGEVRFLFQPLGEISSQTQDANGVEFTRWNVTAQDTPDAYYFNWGGISIERAWIEYKPSDYFGVRAGKYLTPFSMWNVDHGPTVVVPIHMPFLITGQYLPTAQSGLSAFGRAFPSDTTSINYGLTLSNGTGPITDLYDLDDNKAMGANLGFSYDGAVKLDLGTYLYIGDYTDSQTSVGAEGFEQNIKVMYKEKVISANLKFEWAGLLLQAEYIRSLIRFEGDHRYPVQYGTDEELYYPDCVQQATYALIGYRLPFEIVNIMPFFMYEYMEPRPWAIQPVGHVYGGGINWRINPFTVFKVEFYHQNSDEFPQGGSIDYHVINTQLAVTY